MKILSCILPEFLVWRSCLRLFYANKKKRDREDALSLSDQIRIFLECADPDALRHHIEQPPVIHLCLGPQNRSYVWVKCIKNTVNIQIMYSFNS